VPCTARTVAHRLHDLIAVHRLICKQAQNCCPHIATLRSATSPATWPAATTAALSLTVWMMLLVPRAGPTARFDLPATSSTVFELPYRTPNFVTHYCLLSLKILSRYIAILSIASLSEARMDCGPLGKPDQVGITRSGTGPIA